MSYNHSSDRYIYIYTIIISRNKKDCPPQSLFRFAVLKC